MNKTDNAPTKSQMWEQIISLTDKCIEQAWSAGYQAGVAAERETSIILSDLIDETEE